MLKVVGVQELSGHDVTDEVTTIHPPVYVLQCRDSAENAFEIETNKETYIQIADFLDKLRSV